METESPKARTNRCVPVEQWPESLALLRHLAEHQRPMSVRDLSRDLGVPEISTRNRLARLEAEGAITGSRAVSVLAPGKQVTCTHYMITQYGRDCVGLRVQAAGNAPRLCVNSVFALARAMNLQF